MEKYPMVRKKARPKTADSPLSSSVTTSFIEDLRTILADDTSFEAGYLSSELLSKFTTSDTSSASLRRQVAIEKWLSVELTNDTTNVILSCFSSSDEKFPFETLPRVSWKRFYDKVAEVVRLVIGDSPSLHYRNGGFSGGASTSKSRRNSHPAVKFLDKADTTRPALPLFRDIIRGTRWADYLGSDPGLEPRFVEGNVMFTVPKSDVIDRVAAKEPDLNMFLQKGFGNQIRTLLRKKGLNLNDQSINQELARVGSIDGSLMTVDLSSASDSVTIELVRRVLPPNWFYYLDLVRSPVTLIDGVKHVNQMFSSMGNGFTFELESLLFYALTRATAYFTGVKGKISVYGDDIIAPVPLKEALFEVLKISGFTPNARKSHFEGGFRESCGKHWYFGRDVSPFYLRRPFRLVSDLILTLNQLVGWASRDLGVVDPRYEELFIKYRQYIPEQLWGGQDLTSRTSLVTGDRPRKELFYPIETIPHTHVGGLLFWMFVAETRQEVSLDGDPLTTEGSTVPRFARLRLNHQQWMDVPVFLSRYTGLYVEAPRVLGVLT